MIRRALTLTGVPLFALLATTATARAQEVSVNGTVVSPGTMTVKPGDVITVKNNTNQNMDIQGPNGQETIPPGGAISYRVVAGGTRPIVITGPDGRWVFEVVQKDGAERL